MSFIPRKNDLVCFASLWRLLVTRPSENAGFPASSEPSLGSGIALPRVGGAERLYVVTLPASLILAYFQFDPLFFIRAVIDLHLSFNLQEDEDGERWLCASGRISVCL